MAGCEYFENPTSFVDRFPYVSISRQSLKDGTITPAHWHERIELLRVRTGTLSITCNTATFLAKPGTAVLFNPFEVHSLRRTDSDAEFDCIIFDTALFDAVPDPDLPDIGKGDLKMAHCYTDPEILALIERITGLAASARHAQLLLRGYLYEFLGLCLESAAVEPSVSHGPASDEFCRLLDFVHTHYTEELSLEQLSVFSGFSKAYFCQWFKKAVGVTPIQYINTLRINKAYDLLKNTSMSVTDVATAVGFSSLNYFSRQFRERLQRSPSEIKKIRQTPRI